MTRARTGPCSEAADIPPQLESSSRIIARAGAHQTSCAKRLIEALLAHGVEMFFGVPGGPVSPLFDAILGTSAQLVESRHETNAAFAAAGYYRETGKPAAIVVTAGPGITNALTGIASAFAQNTPMIVLAGDVAWEPSPTPMVQNSGPDGTHAEAMLKPIVRHLRRLTATDNPLACVAEAYHIAMRPGRGPAALVVPVQVALRRASLRPVEAMKVPAPIKPSNTSIDEVVAALTSAQHPLLVLGNGCRRAVEEVRRLVDVLGIPFATTPTAKGVVSERHPRSLRGMGLGASTWARSYCEEVPDVVVALGTDLDDCSVDGTPVRASDNRVFRVDHDPASKAAASDIVLRCDIALFADALARAWSSVGHRNPKLAQALRDIKRQSPTFDDPTADNILSPVRAIRELEAGFGRRVRYVSDIGEHMLYALHYLTVESEDSFSLHLPFGSMGSGICGAIGEALLSNKTVVCICGDGGMQMNGMEILVAAQLQLPIVFAVFNDARYNMVYHGFKHAYGGDAEWSTPWVDFAGWARSMGVAGLRVTTPGQLEPSKLARARSKPGPLVLDIRIDRSVAFPSTSRNEALRRLSLPQEEA